MYPPPGYGPAYGQPPPDPRSSPYGDPYGMTPEMAHHAAPPPPHPADPHHQQAPPPGHDPYASHYEAYYRQQGYPPPEQPPGYPPPSSQPPPGYPPPAGYPPPDYHSYPPGHPPPPDGSYPPPVDPHAAHYGAPPPGYPPPGYGAPPPGYPGYPPPGYGAPPPYGYPPPGMVPPGYGPPPGFGPPPGYPGRGPSPRRDNKRIEDKKKKNDGGKGGKGNKDNKNQKKNDFVPGDARSKLQGWLQVHPGWMAVWLEGIDPPRRMASTPNVTTLLVAKFRVSKAGAHELAFTFASTRNGLKKKDREKEAATDLVKCFDQLPLQDFSAWYQLPTGVENRDIMPDDLERVTKAVRAKFVKATVDVPEPTSFVLVASMSAGPHEKVHGADADLALLEKFDPGFAELLREARRVSGLVRKQWYHAILWVKPEPGKDSQRPVALGIGFATDRNLARARAVYSAEMRLPILTEAMFNKSVPEKPVPKKPVDESTIAP